MGSLKSIGAVLVLVITFLILFTVSAQLLLPPELLERAATHPSNDAQSAGGLLVVAAIDVAFVLGVVLTNRLHGVGLWLLTSAVYWGTKTFTGQLEAWYFMPNVSTSMVPWLMLMTVPVALVVPLLAVVFYGRWASPGPKPAWQVPPMGPGQQLWKWVVLSALAYPVLFFVAGYYVALSSEEVRSFYGGVYEDGFIRHLRVLLQSDPRLLPFEILRGAWWVAMAVAVLWTTGGPKWLGGLLVLLLFTLVQNDVHLIPNPLMPPLVQRFHFLETVSSNAVFALLTAWLMSKSHFVSDKTDHHRPATPRLSGAS